MAVPDLVAQDRSDAVETAISELAAGRIVVVVDDEQRENEGDLVVAAEHATAESINFMVSQARGLLCLALSSERCDALGLVEMAPGLWADASRTAFTVSIDARDGVTTGISAAERAHTVRTAADPANRPETIVAGGHVQALRARPGGVLERPGHTEAAVELARLAGCAPAGVICEILNPDGTMARRGDLARFCAQHGLASVTVAELIAHVRVRSVTRTTTTTLATRIGTFDVTGYRGRDGAQHLALSKGDLAEGRPVLARVHSECLTGDVFGSLRCDCGEQLESALQAIEREGRGVLVYLAQEGRGIGLLNKLRAYALQDEGLDTVDANLRLGFAADEREYGEAAAILADLGIRAVRLLTNNPRKVAGLEAAGVAVTERLPLAHAPNPHNTAYLQTKRRRLGHVLEPDVNVR